MTQVSGDLEIVAVRASNEVDFEGDSIGRGATSFFNRLRDTTEGLFNTDSHVVIVDLAVDARWPQVLRITGLSDNEELRAQVRDYVFAHVCQRDDRWNPTIPDDIAGAKPKNDRSEPER